jgi:hypothetical protein
VCDLFRLSIAAHAYVPESAQMVLLHAAGQDEPGAAHGAHTGSLGRGHREHEPALRIEHLAASFADRLLRVATEQLGRPCDRLEPTGRIEREVVTAAQSADLLILARDGDRSRPGAQKPGTRRPLHRRPRPVPRPAGLAIPGTRNRHPAAPPH